MSNCSDKLLAVIGALQREHANLRLESIIVFLQVCKDDGLSIKDLVFLTGLGESMVSRSVEALRWPDGLVRVVQHPGDGRRRLVFLDERGLQLRARIEEILDSDVAVKARDCRQAAATPYGCE